MRVFSESTPAGFYADLEGFGAIALRPMDLDLDLDDLTRWVKHEAAVFWGQAHLDRQSLRDKYASLLADSADAVLIGVRTSTGAKVCMLVPYRARDDEIGRHIPVGEHDWGCHLFMVPGAEPVRHLTYFVLIALQHYVFYVKQAQRLVHQPDIFNHKVTARLLQSGYTPGPIVHRHDRTVRVFTMTAAQFGTRHCSLTPARVAPPYSPLALRTYDVIGRLYRRLGLR